MEDEERRRKLEAGKAKLAEYRQRKAQSDGHKKKRKKKDKSSEQQEEEQEVSGEGKEVAATELSFSRTLHSGETVRHDQTYTMEPESEVSTTAEDYSSEVNGHETAEKPPNIGEEARYTPSRLKEMENELAAKSVAVEELNRELEEIRATSGAEGVQQLQDFEVALKQRDSIITQLTANLQQARAEKDEVMREFLDLTEKSQKLQIQFQQLQAGESLRSSSISSAAADLLQARQQVLLYQQQLEEKGATVKCLRVQLEKSDGKIKNLQEQTEEMDGNVRHLQEQLKESEAKVNSLQEQTMDFQQRMCKLETVSGENEKSFTQTLQEKDSWIKEQERLIQEYEQSLSQLRDNLQKSEKSCFDISEQLKSKVQDLEDCEVQLQASKDKERLSSGEILQLMGTVETLQIRGYQGRQSEGEILLRAEQDASRRLDHLRAELDELYGQQIVQMKQEILARHTEEVANIHSQHSTELKNISDQHCIEIEQLTSLLTQSTGEVNALNVRLIELQQRLQEMQVMREKAESDLTQTSEEKISLQNHVFQLIEELRLKDQEKSQAEMHLQLHATITDLQAQLASVQETSTELEAKHESEITNYQIKLEMLEREKDAVLDRMAESQEAELERLRTQLLFSHEEELFRLQEDLQHESQMNMENLRDELNQRHSEFVQQLRNGYEEQMRMAEDERLSFTAERTSLLQEIVTLKNDLSRALERSQVEGLVSQVEALQAEIQDLRQRQSENVDTERELQKNELTRESEQSWEAMESENKQLKETTASLVEELKSLEEDHKMLIKKMDTLSLENRQASEIAEELRDELERQKSTFSLAEKKFQVNNQELRAELEKRLQEQTLHYEQKLQGLETQLKDVKFEMEQESIQSMKEDPVRGALVEKDTTELMEKLQFVELERVELIKQVEQKESEIKEMKLESAKLLDHSNLREEEFRRVEQEKIELLQLVEQKEAKIMMVELERAGLIEQVEQKEVSLTMFVEEQTEIKDEKLKSIELEKVGLMQQMNLKEEEVQQKEAELQEIKLENENLVQQVNLKEEEVQQKEAELQEIKLENENLVQQVNLKEEEVQQKEAELQEIKLENENLVQQVNLKEEEVQQMEAEVQEIKLEIENLVQQVNLKEEEVQQKEAELQEIKLEIENLVQQVNLKEEEVQQKEAELQEIKLEIENLVQQVNLKEEEVQQMEAELQRMMVVNVALTQKGTLKEEEVQQKEAELQEIKLENENLVQQVNLKEEEVQQKEAELQEIKLENENLVQQVNLKEEEVQQKEAELQEIKLENENLVQQVNLKEEEVQQKEAEVQEIKLEIENLVQQVNLKEEEVQQKEAEVQEIKLEIENLVQQVNLKEEEVQQMEAELQRMMVVNVALTQKGTLKEEEVQQKEATSQKVTENKTLVQQVEQKQQKEVELQRRKLEKVGPTDQVPGKKLGLKSARNARQKVSRVKGYETKSETKKLSQLKSRDSGVELQEEEVVKTEQLLAPPLSQAAAAEEEEREEKTYVCVVPCNDGVKQKTHTRTQIIAAAETLTHAHTHTHTHTQLTAAETHTDRENNLETDSEKQVEIQYGETELVPTVTQRDSMEGFEHEECRLKLEAQRISLSQIHAAQLELLRERLVEWEEPGRQGGAPACSPSLSSVLQDCTHLLQLISGVCVVDTVDVKDDQLQNLQSSIIRNIIDTTREVYRKLQQLNSGVLSSLSDDRNETVCDDHSVSTEDGAHTSTLSDLHMEEVKQMVEVQEEVKEKMELQEEVKQKLELQEEVKQKMELQEEVKQMVEFQKEQHRQEILHLRSYYSEQMRETEEHYTREILLLQERLQDLTTANICNRMSGISEKTQEQQQQLQVQQWEMEEEIARVIVQMSVQFAKQSEMNRISLQMDRQDGWCEETQNQEGVEPECVIEKEEVGRGGDERWYPSMQCSSTQTEKQRRSGEEDEDKEKEGDKKKDKQCGEEDVMVTSQFTSVHTQERVHPVLMDILKLITLMEETIRDKPITHSDMSEMDTFCLVSGATDSDEGLGMSQEAGLAVEGVGSLLSATNRLQKAVEKMFLTLTETRTQLDHARLTQTELMKEKFSFDQQIADLLMRQEELQLRLEEERTVRQKLTLQLHHAEGLIDGYSGERRALEEQVREGAVLQEQLEAELQMTNRQLYELQQERQEVSDQQDLLLRQQNAIMGGATEAELNLVEAAVDDAPEAGLLEETEKLMQEKVDVQRQAQKDHAELLEQVKQMEAELEEQVRAMAKLEETHLSENADLWQQIHALDKQLENNRRFLDEQTTDREHERDIFQQEIQNLEQQLKSSSKPQADPREVEELCVALQEKSDWCSELLLRVDQLQRDVRERDEEIERQEERVRVLEEVLGSHDNHNVAPPRDDNKQHASMAGRTDATLEALLQTEREALDRKEKEIVNLEEQLEQFREELQNKSEEVQQLHMQLEIQRKEISTQQQDLQAHTTLRTVLEEKNELIALLNEQIAKLQLSETTKPDDKEVEVKNELMRELEAQVEHLHVEHERLKRDSEDEVEQLNSVIEKLQQELSKIEHKQYTEDDVEDQHDELKQKMDQIQTELYVLKEDHSSLLSRYESLQEERENEEEKEKKSKMLFLELEDMLREKTAAFLVAQVQIQALEESATFTVTSLTQRVEELEKCLEDREVELSDCRLEVDKAQSEAGTLHLKISQLEEKVKEKVGTLSQVVSQEHIETKIQTREIEYKTESGTVLGDIENELQTEHGELLDIPIAGKEIWLKEKGGVGLDQENYGKELEMKVITGDNMESNVETKTGFVGSTSERVVLLMEKLRNLEEDLRSMAKEQELQKLMLACSKEKFEEYEKMLTKLMELLSQIKATPSETSPELNSVVEKLLQELQEERDRSKAAQEELESCRNLNQNLQASVCSNKENSTVISALHQELREAKSQAKATQTELDSCKDLSRRLQEQIQEREMTIALLKDQVHRTTGEVDSSELLQELQEVKCQAAVTKEELNNYVEQSLKLQEQIQARDASMTLLMEELQQLRTPLSRSEEKDLSSSKKKTGRDHGKVKGGSTAKDKDKQSLSRKDSSTPLILPLAYGSQSVSTLDVGTQVEEAELGSELEDMIGEYTEQIGKIRALHAAEIMDMENRHIAESETLKKDKQRLEQECDALRDHFNKLHPIQVVRTDHSASSQIRDGYTSDSSSEVGSEFRSTPEEARPDNTHLPDRIKALLREVHQEGMQVLSLSELGQSDDSAERSSLMAQITHLQAQLTQLQQDTHSTQQLHLHTPGMMEKQSGETARETDRETDECARLKAELAQVRLELKTSHKTQHTYLRELDTLRAEVCVKVSELDTVSDRLAEEKQRLREFQWEVEREKSRADRRAEGEKEELEDVRLALEEVRQDSAQTEAELSKYMVLSAQLQVQLESQNCRLKELSSDLQKEKELNAELLKHTQHPMQVKDGIPSVADSVLQALQAQLQEKQATLEELMAQAEQRELQELEQKQQWQDEKMRLSRRVEELQSLLDGERERWNGIEKERERLAELMEKSSHREQMSVSCLEQKSDRSLPLSSISKPFLNTAGATNIRDMDSVSTKLQHIASQINRLTVEGAVRESFSSLHKDIQDVLSFLQNLSSTSSAGLEPAALVTGGSSSVLTERLLRQNAELTGFVSRLTEEKNELRNQLLRLEEELRHLQAHSSFRSGVEVSEGVVEVQREMWMREKSRMEKSLHQAETEISRLRAEIRSDVVRDLSTSDSESTTLKRIYGKYLRSESFRKALIYQKKYLLLLLGGFQECEEATLSLIASMTSPHVYTHTTFLQCISERGRAYIRFRSAARVCIALFRMRFLVRRWQKVTGGSINITRNGVGHSPVMEVRNESPYLQPYGDRRGSNRERAGRDSPLTTHSTQHRYGGMSTDGGVSCSHLQSYDPDRALSDYISRLEALQRRLGSVQSGSSSYAQVHFGIRR